MSSFKEKLSKSGQSVLDARASINLDDVKGDITNPLDN